jgi:glyoxylase-like metal-dependent hydrolase (beta-lactamase superfamily II)
MPRRHAVVLLCLLVVSLAAWIGSRGAGDRPRTGGWAEVAPGVLRSPGLPAGYALVAGEHALLLDAPAGAEGLQAHGVKKIDAVLLTHHHRDTAAFAGRFLADGIPVRAPRASAPWLTPEGMRKYWKESLPLRGSRTAYLTLPEGLAGIDCSLADDDTIRWNGWTVRVVAAPGHSADHVAYAAQKGKSGPLLLFCGDALAEPGKIWSPYTTDWDHWTDAGLKPAHESLRKLARLKPSLLLPAHGDVIAREMVEALEKTADTVAEVAFLKSFERYTKERLKNPPRYAFLAREQATTNGSKPWSRISEHLFLTGNTYILVSKESRAFLVVDPWDPYSTPQIAKLKKDQGLGALEVMLCSHAHFDHYDGVYSLRGRDTFEVWTLDAVATPISEPYLLRAPFLDARPVKVDRRFQDGQTARWREYSLRFRYLPGQTTYTMGVETVIDGKKCFFTADNFFHQDQFSGSGGWMGLNRSFPLPYADSAQKVLDARPDWVLAEHGGAMEFNAEDFRRRVAWGKECARAADAICVSGQHRQDWDPHRVHIEPLLQPARAGATLHAVLAANNPLPAKQELTVTLEGRGLTEDQTWKLNVPGKGEVRRSIRLRLGAAIKPGRHIFGLRVVSGAQVDACDAFVGVDVTP